jgi:hypothetical protein
MRILWSEVVLPYVLGGPFGGSYLGTKIIDKMNDDAAEDGSETPMDAFTSVMRRMVGTLRARGVKVAIMNQVAFPAVHYFERLHQVLEVPFFDVYQMMEQPTQQEFRSFDESDTWANEFGKYRDRLQAFQQYQRFRPYLADIFQLNALGQRRLAEGLLRRIGTEFHDFQ